MIFKDVFVFIRDRFILGKKASILMYHSVDRRPEFFAVSPDEFKWQMNYLKRKNYNVISLQELVYGLRKKEKITARTVVITFDDGYADNFKEAFSILKAYGFPATIFLITGLIGNKKYVDKRGSQFSMLDWDQISEMYNSGLISFEPHTVSHPNLSVVELSSAEREMVDSKETIEHKLGNKCHFFAYPKGFFNQDVSKIVSKYFLSALTVRSGFVGARESVFALPRQAIDSAVTRISFMLKV